MWENSATGEWWGQGYVCISPKEADGSHWVTLGPCRPCPFCLTVPEQKGGASNGSEGGNANEKPQSGDHVGQEVILVYTEKSASDQAAR